MLIGILIKMSKIVRKEDMDKVLPLVFDFSNAVINSVDFEDILKIEVD